MKEITELHAWVMVDSDGEEGILGSLFGNKWLPLVTGNPKLRDKFNAIAQHAATEAGEKVCVKRYTLASTEQVILPEEKPNDA